MVHGHLSGGSLVRGFTCPGVTCPGFTCPGFTCPEVHLSGGSLVRTSVLVDYFNRFNSLFNFDIFPPMKGSRYFKNFDFLLNNMNCRTYYLITKRKER